MGRFKWKPNKSQKEEYAKKMNEIDEFCQAHNIKASLSNDSYYFTINEQMYRVSNHSIEQSNAGAYNRLTGEKVRELYHEEGRRDDTIYIHASKTRIIDIYNDLAAGYKLDSRGRRVLTNDKSERAKPIITREQMKNNANKIAQNEHIKSKGNSKGQEER